MSINDQGFTDYEISKVANEYNGLAQVFQSFYAKDSENQEVMGITSYQWLQILCVEVPGKYLGK